MSANSLASRLTRSVAGSLFYSLLANGMIYIGQIVIARELTRFDYATMSVVVALVSLIAMLADLGWTQQLIKRFAQAEVNHVTTGIDLRGKILGTALLIKAILSIAAAIIGVSVAISLYGWEIGALVLIGMSTLAISSRLLVFRVVLESFLRAEGRLEKVTRLAALDAAAFAILLIIWSQLGLSLTAAVAIYSFCHVPGFLFLAMTVRRELHRRSITLSIDTSVARELFRSAMPLTLGTIFLTIHNMADPLILEALSDHYQVSAYSASFRLIAGLLFVPAVVAGVIVPEFVKFIQRGEGERASKLAAFSLQSLLSGAGLIALVLTALAPMLVDVLLGAQYADASELVIIFGWMFLPVAFASFTLDLGIAAERQRIFALFFGVLAAVTVAGDLLVAKEYGAIGVIGIRTLAVLCGCIVIVRECYSQPELRAMIISINLPRNLLAILVPLIMLLALEHIGSPSVLSAAIAATMFILGSMMMGLIDRDRVSEMIRTLIAG